MSLSHPLRLLGIGTKLETTLLGVEVVVAIVLCQQNNEVLHWSTEVQHTAQ